MKIKTRAIVLRKTPFQESSLIVKLFTREKGKDTFVIKGALRQKSPTKSFVQPGEEIEIEYNYLSSKKIFPLYTMRSANDWSNAFSNIKTTMLLFCFIEILDKLYDEREADKDTYDDLIASLSLLNKNNSRTNAIFFWFLFRSLKRAGYDLSEADDHPVLRGKTKEEVKDFYNLVKKIIETNKTEEILKMHKSFQRLKPFVPGAISLHIGSLESVAITKEIFAD
jgi:recombinational DNA repair protein (RecF pathway)